ncbi:hypothetical protein [Nocardia salmonicida]|uniref:hypothetical protein n=1 Tax=Nocardia salmonicida TaxID=53431 RepID=UPI000AF6A59C|nr:hypothetical protein [Nocardia salmonicida]
MPWQTDTLPYGETWHGHDGRASGRELNFPIPQTITVTFAEACLPSTRELDGTT